VSGVVQVALILGIENDLVPRPITKAAVVDQQGRPIPTREVLRAIGRLMRDRWGPDRTAAELHAEDAIESHLGRARRGRQVRNRRRRRGEGVRPRPLQLHEAHGGDDQDSDPDRDQPGARRIGRVLAVFDGVEDSLVEIARSPSVAGRERWQQRTAGLTASQLPRRRAQPWLERLPTIGRGQDRGKGLFGDVLGTRLVLDKRVGVSKDAVLELPNRRFERRPTLRLQLWPPVVDLLDRTANTV
jgi:hypothetical protein